MNYDIIGDIHGHADELELLLQKLGYRKRGGVYEHPDNRKVAFLGDFIDRGPKIREVLHIVKDMVETGNADAIMGNHEFNAIAFHTPSHLNGEYCRPRTEKNTKQHFQTLKQFENHPDEWEQFLDWFKSLPVHKDYANFRTVHACWDNDHISWLSDNFDSFKDNDQIIRDATTKGTDIYRVMDELLKGKEQTIPGGHFFHDKDGNKRFECRVKWWQPLDKRNTYGDVMMACPESISSEPLKDQSHFHYSEDKPVFFGHYWLSGIPKLENSNAICLDYSVAKGGNLVAYRSEYLNAHEMSKGFVFVQSK